jgi:hypothetical protein
MYDYRFGLDNPAVLDQNTPTLWERLEAADPA